MNKDDFYTRPKYEVFKILNERSEEDLREISDGLLGNSIYISRQFKTIESEPDKLWDSDPFRNRTWRYWVHSLIMIEYLLNAYELFNNKPYLDKALEFVWSWKRHSMSGSHSDMVWHDHATAHRLILISRLAELLRLDQDDKPLLEELSELAKHHCSTIEKPGFYQPRHNHGLDQNAAMYVGATIFNHLAKSDYWRELSLNRLKKQLGYLFLTDGSYLEQTPVYSFIFCNRLMKYISFFKQDGNPQYQLLEDTILNQLHCLTYLVQPDGMIPPLGDGNPSPLSLKHLRKLDHPSLAYPEYVLSKGKKGTPPAQLDMAFPRGGYAAMRNKWVYDKETVQIIFSSAFHIKTHKHHDDLSINLFAHGKPLISDSGKYNFNYSSRERKYVISSYAHNSVVVDDSDSDIDPSNIEKSCLTSYYWSQDTAYCSGAHALYKGVIHRRMLFYLKPWDIVIVDFLSSAAEHKYEQIFNFYPGIECYLERDIVNAVPAQGKKIRVNPLLEEGIINTVLIKGQEEPLRGWCCVQYGSLQPSWSMGYIKRGENVFFATQINLKPERNIEFLVKCKGNSLSINSSDKYIELLMNRENDELKMNGKNVSLNQVRKISEIIHPRRS